MSLESRIVLYGLDAPLAKSRAMILRHHGFNVHSVGSAAEFAAQQQSPAPALLIFCHTLTQKECRKSIAMTAARWPNARLLSLVSGSQGCSGADVGEVLDAQEGPNRLVGVVSMLLAGTAPTSTNSRVTNAWPPAHPARNGML